MHTSALELEGVGKTFRSRRVVTVAVDSLDLVVESGEVLGLLGPNGAGKTTTLRMIAALASTTRGQIRIFGRPLERSTRRELLNRVGIMIERPTFEPRWSGMRNLEWLRRYKIESTSQPADVLEYVGLDPDDRRAVRAYSLGMLQRLSLAATLLKDPELLILDEPTIGLDPAGIAQFRDLARDLAAERGIAILVSSHLLDEMQRICDRVTIISEGRVQVSGRLTELLNESRQVHLVADPLDAAVAVLIAAGYRAQAGDGRITVPDADPQAVARTLFDAGMYATSIDTSRNTLEGLFRRHTSPAHAPLQGDER